MQIHNLAQIGSNHPPSDIDIVRSRLEEKEKSIRQALNSVCANPLPVSIEDEFVAGEVTERIKGLISIKRGVESAHKDVKAPYLECSRATDGWKNKLETEIISLQLAASKILNDFLNRRAEVERLRQIEFAKAEREKADKLAAEAAAHQEAEIHDVADELMDAALKSEQTASRIEQNVNTGRPSDFAKSRGAYGATSSQKRAWVGTILTLRGIDLEVLRPYFTEEVIQKALNAFVKNGGRECGGAEIKEQITGLNIR